MIDTFFQILLTVEDNVDLPLSTGKITIDVSDRNSFKALHSSLYRLSLGSLEFWHEPCHLSCPMMGEISFKT